MAERDEKKAAEQDFTYYAFISYSHKDAKRAEWIQRAIEHYKLPAVIRKEAQKPLPKRIAPVFRDATDLGRGRAGGRSPRGAGGLAVPDCRVLAEFREAQRGGQTRRCATSASLGG